MRNQRAMILGLSSITVALNSLGKTLEAPVPLQTGSAGRLGLTSPGEGRHNRHLLRDQDPLPKRRLKTRI